MSVKKQENNRTAWLNHSFSIINHKKVRGVTSSLLLLAIAVASPKAHAEETSISDNVTKIRQEFQSDFAREVRSKGYSVGERLWEEFSRVHVNKDFGKVRANLELNRSIDDSRVGSITVLDQVHASLNIPLLSQDIGNLISSKLPISIHAGLSGGIDLRNYRIVKLGNKVKSEELTRLERHGQELISKIKSESKKPWFESAVDELERDKNSSSVTGNGDNGELGNFTVDRIRHARYHRILNRLSFPLRIPLKAKNIDIESLTL